MREQIGISSFDNLSKVGWKITKVKVLVFENQEKHMRLQTSIHEECVPVNIYKSCKFSDFESHLFKLLFN